MVGELWTISNGLDYLEIRGQVETVQNIALRLFLRTKTCCHSKSNKNPPALAGGKRYQKRKIIRIKRTCRRVDHTVLADHRVKIKENDQRDKYLDFAWELKKTKKKKTTIEHDGDSDTNCS